MPNAEAALAGRFARSASWQPKNALNGWRSNGSAVSRDIRVGIVLSLIASCLLWHAAHLFAQRRGGL